MSTAAQRMRRLRNGSRESGLRTIRLTVPDARLPEVRRRIAEQSSRLDPKVEEDAMRWIEAVQVEYDTPDE